MISLLLFVEAERFKGRVGVFSVSNICGLKDGVFYFTIIAVVDIITKIMKTKNFKRGTYKCQKFQK